MWANAQRDGRPAITLGIVAICDSRGVLCSTPQSLADAYYYMPCSNAAKTRNQLNFAGVPKTGQPISAVSGP